MATVQDDIRVSVIIPLYNSASTLRRAVESVLAQTEPRIEIVIVDDGSKDDGWELASALALENPRIRAERLPHNQGKPTAMNAGTAAARGRWIAVLDADDWYHPERLKTLVDLAERHKVDFVSDNQFLYDAGADTVVGVAFPDDGQVIRIEKNDFVENINPESSFDYGRLKPIIARQFISDHSLSYYPPAGSWEDFFYHLDYFAAGGSGVLTSKPYYYWTQPFGSVSRNWTNTGLGAWRYDYAKGLRLNNDYIAIMRAKGNADIVRMLEKRSRRFAIMVHYVGAQKNAAEGRFGAALIKIAGHPSTWPLLGSRIGTKIIDKLHR